jgi:HPt (histidine-containing phosphotransfer) domain-containing protein
MHRIRTQHLIGIPMDNEWKNHKEMEGQKGGEAAKLSVALERMGGNEEFLAKMAGLFLAETSGVIEKLQDAWKAGQAVEMEGGAHRLKGQAATFEATLVVRLAAEMERQARQGRLDQAGELLPSLRTEMDALHRQLSSFMNRKDLPSR